FGRQRVIGRFQISRAVLPHSRPGAVRYRRTRTRGAWADDIFLRHRRRRLASPHQWQADHCFGDAAARSARQRHSLLHDIRPATAAALPGLLKELKDNGFHIVQVVPAASYVIAMANKPRARTLASTLPREPTISDDGNRGAQPRWPHVVAGVAPD